MALSCTALAVVVHDDDVLMMSLYDRGTNVDIYLSDPEYFGDVGGDGEFPEQGGDATALANAFGMPGAASDVDALLRDPLESFMFETERHRQLMEALQSTHAGVGVGYADLVNGEYADACTAADYVQVFPKS